MNLINLAGPAAAFLFAQWLIRFYLVRGEKATDTFRYLAYTFVGVGLGILAVGFYAVAYPSFFQLSHHGLWLIFSMCFFGSVGFEAARIFPNSFVFKRSK